METEPDITEPELTETDLADHSAEPIEEHAKNAKDKDDE